MDAVSINSTLRPGSPEQVQQLQALVPSVAAAVTPHLVELSRTKFHFVATNDRGERYLVPTEGMTPDAKTHFRLLAHGKESAILLAPGQTTSDPLVIKVVFLPTKRDEQDRCTKMAIKWKCKLGQQQHDQLTGNAELLSDRLRALLPEAVPVLHQVTFAIPDNEQMPLGNFALVENLCPPEHSLLEFGQVQKGSESVEVAVRTKAHNAEAVLAEATKIRQILADLDDNKVPNLEGFKCGNISRAIQVDPTGYGRVVLVDLDSAMIFDRRKLGRPASIEELCVPQDL